MEQMTTVLLGKPSGEDGMPAYARPVLFASAGEWVIRALPREACGQILYLCDEGETPIEGAQSVETCRARYDALGTLDLPEDVLLIAAPMPELGWADYSKLIKTHHALGMDVTMLCCQCEGDSPTAVVRNARDEVMGVGHGNELHVLHAAVFKSAVLKKALSADPDCIYHLINAAAAVGATMDVAVVRPVIEIVDGASAYKAQKKLMARINYDLIDRGVSIFAPETTYIAPDAAVAPGAVILPNCLIRGGCKIGAGAVIGPNTILEKASVGAGTTVNNSQIYESSVGEGATVGPFAYIRPGCQIGDHTRIGDFVELKKAQIGNGTKVSHLTYIGDAEVGERVNFGCGTVVVNYDGYTKSLTKIGDDCFIGCNTNLVAPVELGDRVLTAAGTTVTKDVEDGAMVISRPKQTVYDGWNDRRRRAHGQDTK